MDGMRARRRNSIGCAKKSATAQHRTAISDMQRMMPPTKSIIPCPLADGSSGKEMGYAHLGCKSKWRNRLLLLFYVAGARRRSNNNNNNSNIRTTTMETIIATCCCLAILISAAWQAITATPGNLSSMANITRSNHESDDDDNKAISTCAGRARHRLTSGNWSRRSQAQNPRA